WEFWPEQSAAAELDGSLARMGFDYVDVIYANPPPEGLAIPDMVAAVGGLLDAGKARAWAMVNWQAGPCGAAVAAAAAQGGAPPRPPSPLPSRSPTPTSPACCSGRPARSRSGPTARRPTCWTGSALATSTACCESAPASRVQAGPPFGSRSARRHAAAHLSVTARGAGYQATWLAVRSAYCSS